MSNSKGRHITKIQHRIFWGMLLLASFMSLLIASISIFVTLKSEKENLESNLINLTSAITNSDVIRDELSNQELTDNGSVLYLNSLKSSISNVDVISLVSKDEVRLYHTNSELVGTHYDGTLPDFSSNGNIYVSSDVGPSGSQRRVYGAIYDRQGNYEGFVLVVLLNQHIYKIIIRIILIHVFIYALVVLLAAFISGNLSRRIKHSLWGYEPDAFSAMYSVRDNILESFEEGIIAIDYDEKILFMNKSAQKICGVTSDYSLNIKDYPILSKHDIRKVLTSGEKVMGTITRTKQNIDALVNYYPVIENERLIGAICVLLDRTEYTAIMNDLTGNKFLVDSMRANNHDFINKLHVILGLVQMGDNKAAIEYISNITTIQQDIISGIMRNIENSSIAALLIGKYSKASELDISFSLQKGSQLRSDDCDFNTTDLITIIGNLIENAFEALNTSDSTIKEVSIGIFTNPGAMLVRVDDSGPGIPVELREKLFEKGITSKGSSHGTGLYIVKQLVERNNGTITFETELGEGTSFEVVLVNEEREDFQNV